MRRCRRQTESAARDRYADVGAAGEHVITGDDFGDPLEHSPIVASPFNSL